MISFLRCGIFVAVTMCMWLASASAAPKKKIPDYAAPIASTKIKPEDFRYHREILVKKAGFNTLDLDLAVLSHSTSFPPNNYGELTVSDIRILTQDGKEVPFLVNIGMQDWGFSYLPLKIPPRSSDPKYPKTSRYDIELPYESVPAAGEVFPTALVLKTDRRVFSRNVWIATDHTPQDKRRPYQYDILDRAKWTDPNPEPHLAPDVHLDPRLSLSHRDVPRRIGKLYLFVEEGDNDPLPLSKIFLEAPVVRLTFFHTPPTQLTLYYGNKHLAPPRYDLKDAYDRAFDHDVNGNPKKSYKGPILSEFGVYTDIPPHEASLGPEIASQLPASTQPSTPISRYERPLFWGILILMVAVLIGIVVRMLKKP